MPNNPEHYRYERNAERREDHRRSADFRRPAPSPAHRDRPYTRKRMEEAKEAERRRRQAPPPPQKLPKRVRRAKRGPKIDPALLKLFAVGAVILIAVIAGIVLLVGALSGGTRHAMPSITLPTAVPTQEPAADIMATAAPQTEMTSDGLPVL